MRYRNALWIGTAMLAGAVGSSLVGPRPALAVGKEIVEIQNDVELLLQGQLDMQNSMAQNQGVLKTLIQQLGASVSGSVDKLATSADAFQKSMLDFRANSGVRSDTTSTELQSLSDKLDDLAGRLSKVNQQLVDLQNSVQDLGAKPATNPSAPSAGVTAAPSSGTGAAASAPSADVLYSNGYRDIISGNYDLAKQEFQQYLNNYPGTELASNAQFYLGEIASAQKKYAEAVSAYDKVLQNYPDSFKRPSARFKKAEALISLGQKQAGIDELREVIQDYPGSDEAKLARARLHLMGVSVKPPSH